MASVALMHGQGLQAVLWSSARITHMRHFPVLLGSWVTVSEAACMPLGVLRRDAVSRGSQPCIGPTAQADTWTLNSCTVVVARNGIKQAFIDQEMADLQHYAIAKPITEAVRAAARKTLPLRTTLLPQSCQASM